MKIMLDEFKREIRRMKDVAPNCNDEGINTLMDIHDNLVRMVKKLEASLRNTTRSNGQSATDDHGKTAPSLRE